MLQYPMLLWQDVAAHASPPQTRWGRAMAGGQQAIDKLIAAVDKEQEAQGVPDKVTLAFETVAPLLAENKAVLALMRATNQPGLLPDRPDARAGGTSWGNGVSADASRRANAAIPVVEGIGLAVSVDDVRGLVEARLAERCIHGAQV